MKSVEGGEGLPAAWTFMLYAVFDSSTSVEQYLLPDLEQIRASGVGGDSRINVLTLIECTVGCATLFEALNLQNERFENQALFTITHGEYAAVGGFESFSIRGDVGTRLSAFIEYSLKELPAENFALILFDHVNGWFGFRQDTASASRVVSTMTCTSLKVVYTLKVLSLI
ncbi:hypothetical protein CYMTET_29726 [Cymbomonas tetramitiformis]|uniref:Uncharacterized protein n=1 Tax=Cymbomonas tetramitiformis TaxID=36881 RepID=A0AAE0KUM6_9CHLO|nr:hypothetical protein CYMTET_29726 [Cymbomonas tetramitiformis]